MVPAAMDWGWVPVKDPRSSIGMALVLPKAPAKGLLSTDMEKDQAKLTTINPFTYFFLEITGLSIC